MLHFHLAFTNSKITKPLAKKLKMTAFVKTPECKNEYIHGTKNRSDKLHLVSQMYISVDEKIVRDNCVFLLWSLYD